MKMWNVRMSAFAKKSVYFARRGINYFARRGLNFVPETDSFVIDPMRPFSKSYY